MHIELVGELGITFLTIFVANQYKFLSMIETFPN